MNFSKIKNDILCVSIKPQFASKIFDGSKRIELRKSKPKVHVGDYVLIYVTVPVKAIKGICRVKGIIETTPSDLWANHYKLLGVDQKLFDEYYEGHNTSIGIEIEDVIEFKTEVSLDTIRKYIPRFAPPQTFRYFEPELVSNFL